MGMSKLERHHYLVSPPSLSPAVESQVFVSTQPGKTPASLSVDIVDTIKVSNKKVRTTLKLVEHVARVSKGLDTALFKQAGELLSSRLEDFAKPMDTKLSIVTNNLSRDFPAFKQDIFFRFAALSRGPFACRRRSSSSEVLSDVSYPYFYPYGDTEGLRFALSI